MMPMDWNLARAFAMTADTGSLSAAARRLGLTQPTLSRQVAEFEGSLGVALFERVGKKLVLTETGLSLLDHARAMATAAEAMALAAAGRSQDIGGVVRISATDAMAAYLLPDVVETLRRRAPQVTIGIVASNALSDLRRREADIAIRHVQPSEDALIGRLVGTATARLYASRDWVARKGLPAAIGDLDAEDLVGFEPVDEFAGHLTAIGMAVSADRFRIVSENSVVLWEMVRRGLGVGMMLEEIAGRTPGLVRLLPQLPAVPVPVWLVTHRELRSSARVRLVFDVLAEALRRILVRGRAGEAR